MLGFTTAFAGAYDEAISASRRAVELQRRWTNLRILGLSLDLAGKTEEAISILEEAVAVSGRHPWTVGTLSVALAEVDPARRRKEDRELNAFVTGASIDTDRKDRDFDRTKRAARRANRNYYRSMEEGNAKAQLPYGMK